MKIELNVFSYNCSCLSFVVLVLYDLKSVRLREPDSDLRPYLLASSSGGIREFQQWNS